MLVHLELSKLLFQRSEEVRCYVWEDLRQRGCHAGVEGQQMGLLNRGPIQCPPLQHHQTLSESEATFKSMLRLCIFFPRCFPSVSFLKSGLTIYTFRAHLKTLRP